MISRGNIPSGVIGLTILTLLQDKLQSVQLMVRRIGRNRCCGNIGTEDMLPSKGDTALHRSLSVGRRSTLLIGKGSLAAVIGITADLIQGGL